jgi:hypothetical protein
MDTQCSSCQRPYGKRRRCYWCNGPKKRTGETLVCAHCGQGFYAARWQLLEEPGRQPVYCSKPCKYAAMRLNGPGYEYRRQDGYIQVYYPTHPDAPKSGWMLKHRVVAEAKYGRRLARAEHVHHLNGIKDDNRPENLEVLGAGAHALLSSQQGVVQRQSIRAELAALRMEVAAYRQRYGPLEPEG